MIYILITIISYLILNQLLHGFMLKINLWIHILICCLCMILSQHQYLIFMIFIVLYMISFIDFKTMYIYDASLLVYLFLIIIYTVDLSIHPIQMWLSFIYISCISLLNFNKERIGIGDLYLLYASSLCFSISDLSMIMLVACVGALLYILIFKKKSEYIPFAPFLCVGIILMMI